MLAHLDSPAPIEFWGVSSRFADGGKVRPKVTGRYPTLRYAPEIRYFVINQILAAPCARERRSLWVAHL